jgi:hypothetical protein
MVLTPWLNALVMRELPIIHDFGSRIPEIQEISLNAPAA